MNPRNKNAPGRQPRAQHSKSIGTENEMQTYDNTDIEIRRRSFWRHDINTGARTIGHLISTPAGFQLQTQDAKLRWFRRRYYRTPGHLIDAVRLQQIRGRS